MADTTIGAKLVLDAGGAVKSMKDFKQEIKDARTDLLNLQATFGATSKEALNAAKRVAELEDNLKDASETTKLFDPGNKFQVLGNAVRGLVGGFTAPQGALALAGVEGEDLQKTLVKVQSALALTEGLNVVADVTKDFKRLGSVLIQTLGKSGAIGLAIAGVTALGLALSGLFDGKKNAALEAYNDTLKDYTKAAADARQKTIEVKVAFEQARAGVINKDQALKIYNDTLGDSLGKTNDLGTAEKLLADKAETYIKITGLKAQANALFAKSAQMTSDILIEQDKLIKDGQLTIAGVNVTKKYQENLDKAKVDAQSIEKIGEDLLRQAGKLSSAFNINTGPKLDAAKTTTQKTEDPEIQAIKDRGDVHIAVETEITKKTREEYEKRLEDQKEFDKNSAEIIGFGRDLSKSAADGIIADQKRIGEEQAAQLEQERIAKEARVQFAQDIGGALGALADLVGKQTAAGKALAIAQAVINTWVGVTEVLKTKSVLPEPIATIARIANIAAVVATGLNAIKNIGKAQVPGASGTGGANVSAPAPLRPQVPNATSTVLDQGQLNQIGNATVRAFVVESDVTNNQDRIRRLNRAARI